jgi:SPP1 family predicted phage head-tail adaptor
MVGINPGELREVVSFHSKVEVPNGSGGFTATYPLSFKTFAKVAMEKPSRGIEAGQLVSVSTRKVVVRYSASREVEIDMRMEWQGKQYQIVSIDELDPVKLLVALTVTRSK